LHTHWRDRFNVIFTGLQFTKRHAAERRSGSNHLQRAHSEFRVQARADLYSFLLADEINRATPKTQSALLEAMNEMQVTIEGHSYPLAEPFMVDRDADTGEHHGTYPLPESQLDRFLMAHADWISGPAGGARNPAELGPRGQQFGAACAFLR